ncbi:MAG: response regulator [Acidobacteria bacterium]|nr:response regulator [Acidobacteriota bacterium]
MLKPILLVEDSGQDVELTLAALTKARLANEVIVLRDGEEAMDYLSSQGRYATRARGNPALILLDIKLPKVDGLEVLAFIKSQQRLKSIPVVMLTSSREEPDLTASYQSGANAYVVKPVRFQDFVKAVQDLGGFWAMLNEPPPGSVRFRRPE